MHLIFCMSLSDIIRLFLNIYWILILFFFFYYSYCASRDLHSFPTRRSSDLGYRQWQSTRKKFGRFTNDGEPCAPPGNASMSRSEEHTSELQSRFDLVCRLLLEKKKILNILATM